MSENEFDQPKSRPTRRSLLTAMFAAGAAAGVSTFGGSVRAQDATPTMDHMDMGEATPETASPVATPPPPPFVGVTGQPLVQPEVRTSIDGVLDTTLEAKIGTVNVAGVDVNSLSYDGIFPGPTLRIKHNDTLKLALTNSLDDVTNIHTHGFHVSPKDNSDNIFIHVNPGETFQYEYNLPPTNLPGTYWYHPHAHGNTSEQVTFGLAGAIICEGGLDELEGIKGLTEQILVLQTTQFDGNGQMFPKDAQTAMSRMRLINGQLQPVISMRPGETQRWRILNVCSDDFFLLSLSGHELNQIAGDGNAYKRTDVQDQILLAPAERADLLIQASTTPGTYEFRTLQWGPSYQAQPDLLLATLVIAGDPIDPQPIPMDLIPFEDLSTLPIDNARVIEFQEPGAPLYLAIDGKHFDPDRIDQTVKLGALEEWTLINSSSHWHPFHIHVNDFQVVGFNGDDVEALAMNDTVSLPPGTSTVIRIPFYEFDGKFVFHCHILEHEDFGMMATVEVVP